jgi:acyl-coenzyme A synthetase/AMP-(fatty) acid ligase
VIVPAGDPPTLDSLRGHVKRRHPSFMAPKRLTVVEALPRTNLGKLRRVQP